MSFSLLKSSYIFQNNAEDNSGHENGDLNAQQKNESINHDKAKPWGVIQLLKI